MLMASAAEANVDSGGLRSRRTPSIAGPARTAAELGFLSGVVLVIAYLTLRMWRIPFGLALHYGGDELAGLAHVKGVD